METRQNQQGSAVVDGLTIEQTAEHLKERWSRVRKEQKAVGTGRYVALLCLNGEADGKIAKLDDVIAKLSGNRKQKPERPMMVSE